jgi:hemin uptake protein HemP
LELDAAGWLDVASDIWRAGVGTTATDRRPLIHVLVLLTPAVNYEIAPGEAVWPLGRYPIFGHRGSEMNQSQDRPAASAGVVKQGPGPRWRLVDLLQGHRDIVIEHEGQDYRLRLTANGKLILTK